MRATPAPPFKSLRMSKARARWLLRLAEHGIVARRPRGSPAFECARAGWTALAHRDPASGDIVLHEPTVTGQPPSHPPEGEALTALGWRQLALAVEFLPEAEAVLYLRGTEAAQRRTVDRFLHELGRAEAGTADLAPEALRLARLLMGISEASGAGRLVIGAALWRCVAGFHARTAADAGEPPEIAGASVLETAAEMAEALLRSRTKAPPAQLRLVPRS